MYLSNKRGPDLKQTNKQPKKPQSIWFMCCGSHPNPRHIDFFLVASQEVVAGSWLDYFLKN